MASRSRAGDGGWAWSVEGDRFVVLGGHHVAGSGDGVVTVTVTVTGAERRGADAELGTDALGDLDHHLGVLDQEHLGVLTALAQLLAVVGVPSARLLHEADVDAHVEQGALAADALAVHDVDLALAEGRGALVLHDLDPGAVAHHLDAVLDRLDAAHVEPDRRVELERPAA